MIVSCVAVRSLMALSLQVDLVLSGAAATDEPKLVQVLQLVFSHSAYCDAVMRPKCVQRPRKIQYLRKVLQ